jgi:hypothetical protein
MKVARSMVNKNKGDAGVVETVGHNIEVDLVKRIDDYLADKNNGKRWKKSAGFAPSNTNNCARFLGYRLRGFEADVNFPGQVLRIFDQGHDVEERLVKYFTALGMVKKSQVNLVRSNPPIDCWLDILIEYGDKEIPIEVKSISNEGFVYRKGTHKPKDEHYRQLQIYLDIGGWDFGILYYVNKNNNEHLPIFIEKNQEFLDKLYARWNAIYDAHKKGELSVRPFKQTSKKCRECDAFNWCYNVDSTVGIVIKTD